MNKKLLIIILIIIGTLIILGISYALIIKNKYEQTIKGITQEGENCDYQIRICTCWGLNKKNQTENESSCIGIKKCKNQEVQNQKECYETDKHSNECVAQGGIWLTTHNECIGITNEACQTLGGTYEDCASICRHNKGLIVECPNVCEKVCKNPKFN